MRTSPTLIEERIPGSRQFGKLAFWLVAIALVVLGSGDFVVSVIAVVGGAAIVIVDMFSVFGWEHLIVTGDGLRIERRLFGIPLKVLEIPRSEIESITVTPKPKGIDKFSESEDRDQNLWTFLSGPIVVETSSSIHMLGQGLLRDRDTARAVVDRINDVLNMIR